MSSNNPVPAVYGADKTNPQVAKTSSTPSGSAEEDHWRYLEDLVTTSRIKPTKTGQDENDHESELSEESEAVKGMVEYGIASSRGGQIQRGLRMDDNSRWEEQVHAWRTSQREELEDERRRMEKEKEQEEQEDDHAIPESHDSVLFSWELKEKMEQSRLSRKPLTIFLRRGSTSSREHDSTACSGFGRSSGERLEVPNGPAWRQPPSLDDRRGMVRSVEDFNVHAPVFGRAGSEQVREVVEKEMIEEKKEREMREAWMPEEEESALQKASRLAREQTESGNTPLNMRREGFGMLVPFKGVAESREVPVYERPGVIRGTDKQGYERWKMKEEEEEARKKASELKATSRYASSFAHRRAARDAASKAGLVETATAGANVVPNVVVGTSTDAKQDKGKGKAVEHEEPLLEPPTTASSPESFAERSFDEVWEELCAENGWDENDEVKKKIYHELVAKVGERYRKSPTPQSECVTGLSVATGIPRSREGIDAWFGQKGRPGVVSLVCSYGSTESREVVDERASGFGRSRQGIPKFSIMPLPERQSGREVDTPFRHKFDTTLWHLPPESDHFQASDNDQISQGQLAMIEVRGRLEREERESWVEVKKGGAISREDALRREYEEEHARLERVRREEYLPRMEQEAKQDKEERLWKMLEGERQQVTEKHVTKGSTDSREDELRREYEAEKAHLERLDREQPLYTREWEGKRLEMLKMGVAGGITQSRKLPRYDANKERGSAVSRETALRREYEEERARQHRLQREEFMSQVKQSKQLQRTYSIGKEHLGDSSNGFRSRSTIGTTSAEKMPMRGSNDAGLMMIDGGMVDEDDDDVEVNIEGLVLRTRVQVPDAMRRAMEKDEEWRGFA